MVADLIGVPVTRAPAARRPAHRARPRAGRSSSLSERAPDPLRVGRRRARRFERLTEAFYDRVREDDLLEPVFRGHGPGPSPRTWPLWLAEVFGGPAALHRGARRLPAHARQAPRPRAHRGHAAPLGQPDLRRRRRCRAAGDPEFRSAFVAYIEWGTRLAVANSQPDAEPPPEAPVPRWGWGEAPPYSRLEARECAARRSRRSSALASCQRVPARPCAARVEAQAGHEHEDVAAVRVDRDPPARPRRAVVHERARGERPARAGPRPPARTRPSPSSRSRCRARRRGRRPTCTGTWRSRCRPGSRA